MTPDRESRHKREERSSSDSTHDSGVDAAAEESTPTAAPGSTSWAARVQHVSLRTKLVVPMILLSVLPALGVGVFTISRMRQTLKERLVQQIEFETVSKARSLETFLQGLHRDLRVLSQIREIQDVASAEAAGVASSQVDPLRSAAERELAVFAQGRQGYHQLRYLNGSAEEVLRLESVEGTLDLVPAADLRSGSDPHYLEAAFAMEPGKIYVSQLGLNEYGADDRAGKTPILSCATPVVWNEEEGRGLLVVDVDAPYMFSLVGNLFADAEAWLVDQNDVYIGYAGGDVDKRARYSMGRRRPISVDFTAPQLAAIRANKDRPHTLETEAALVSFAPIVFDTHLADQRWALMIAYPIDPVYAPVSRLTLILWSVLALVLVLALMTGVLVAHYVSRPLAILRGATRQIAAGDLNRQVAVATGDEIEGLAVDFNTMTNRLRSAQQRLARWNDELRLEVARKTENLHRLQTGLARADKLASVGQMAASIMHEIGNPLAAIKTKIQVAEEGEEFEPSCRDILDELIEEVDRLSAVLRSFSRFGKLREPAFEPVAVRDVVQGVITLVTPELERKGLSLIVTTREDCPRVRGDADQLRQLLINLILNAAEASPDGGKIQVRVQRKTRANSPAWVSIEVADGGQGIAPENLGRIWDPMYTSKSEGTGLGLAICRRIVLDHLGEISVQSVQGEGTAFSVDFPGLDD